MTITTRTQVNEEYLNIALKLNDLLSDLEGEAMECEDQFADLIDTLHYLISENNNREELDFVDLEPV